jgi:hypothetical protein
MAIDVSTRAGALRFAELRRGEMVRQYLAWGRLEKNPLLYVFATHDFSYDTDLGPSSFRTRAKLPEVRAVPIPLPEAAKEKIPVHARTRILGQAVRLIAKVSKASGVLLMMDSWFSSGENAPEDHHYGWIEENPEAEGLYMRLEHQHLAHPVAWAALIHRDPLSLDPWRGGEQVVSDQRSRLSHMIDWSS